MILSIPVLSCKVTRIKDKRFVNYFSNQERNRYEQLLIELDKIVLKKTLSDNIESAYVKYFTNLKEVSSNQELIESLSEERSSIQFVIANSKDHWSAVWINAESWDPVIGIYKSTRYEINTTGKYLQFLELVKDDNELLKEYYYRINDLGFIPPSMISTTPYWNEYFDLNNNLHRLIFAIHIFTIAQYTG